MTNPSANRRDFLKLSAGALLAGSVGYHSSSAAAQDKPASPNERPGIGSIGLRYQGSVVALKAQSHGNIVALCDVDRHVREQGRAAFGSTPKIFEDYHDLLARSDVDVVTIGTPDHWHTKMVVDACRAGKSW